MMNVRRTTLRAMCQGTSLLITAGCAHIILSDPDGNVIMIDQHVGRPE